MLSTLLLVWVCVKMSSAQLPLISTFTQPGNIDEDTDVAKKVAEIKPAAGSDPIYSCGVNSNPSGPFIAQRKSGDMNFWVYYDASSVLDYDVDNFYQLKITCYDNIMFPSNVVDLFVYVQPNSPPVIKNYPSDYVTLNANSFSYSNDVVYNLAATDPEGDALTYALSNQQPNIGLFSLDSQASTRVKATKDLRSIAEPSFLLTFTVSDGKNIINDFTVLVTVNNLNTRPAILNLPSAVSVPENAPGGTTLIKLSVEDPTQYPGPIFPVCTTFPAADGSKFQYNAGSSTITITGNNLLDYESRDTYTITCSATDGFLSSSSSDILTVNVQNIIEGLTFNSNDYYCKLTEGEVRKSYCTLPITVTDLDGYSLENVAFEASTDSENFFYDKDTKRVYLNVNYDVDNNLMPTSADLVLKAEDTGGSSATTSVHITVSDANDNTCHLNKEISYNKVDQFTSLGTLDTFTVTDDDLSSPNNVAEIQVVSVNPPDSVNYITVSDKGVVSYIDNIPTSRSGSSYTMIIRCKDGGVPTRTSLATVIVSYTVLATTTVSSPPTSSTTMATKDIWDYDWFVAVFSLLMLCVVAGLTAAVAFLVYRYCCQKSLGSVETSRNKISPLEDERKSGRRSQSFFDYDDDDLFNNSAVSNYNYNRTWQNSVSPRQIPALEYK